MKSIIYGVIGSVIALLISQILLSGSVKSLIPWGLVAVLLGYLASSRKESIISGAVYGFIVSFVFMLGYAGTAPEVSRIPFFAAIGLFGALCAMLASFIVFIIKSKLKLSKNQENK